MKRKKKTRVKLALKPPKITSSGQVSASFPSPTDSKETMKTSMKMTEITVNMSDDRETEKKLKPCGLLRSISNDTDSAEVAWAFRQCRILHPDLSLCQA